MKFTGSLKYIICVGVVILSCTNQASLKTVSEVSLEKYSGRWYEIATIPIRAQKDCKCTFAEYSIHEEGHMVVYNQCISTDGGLKSIKGKAYSVSGSNNSKLKVQFFWPFKADYQIIMLAEDYSYAMVGSPNRKFLWVLAREKTMKAELYKNLLHEASAKGFDINRLVKTVQDCE